MRRAMPHLHKLAASLTAFSTDCETDNCLAVLLYFRIFAFLHFCTFAFLHFCIFALLHFCIFALLHFCTFAFALLHFCTFALLHFCTFAGCRLPVAGHLNPDDLHNRLRRIR